ARAPDTALDGTLSASSRAPSTAHAERTIALAGDLAGTLVDRRLPRSAPHLARLRFDARAGDRDIELHSAEASLGSAKASLAGRMNRPAADAPWHAAGRVALSDFDPAPWWPGPPDSLLSRGPNRLNAKGDFDVVLARSFAGSVYDILAATRGKATLSMADSALAGVPLEADASFVNSDGTARPSLDLLLAGNRLKARGRVAASATADAWTLDIDAPQLLRLAPLARRPGTAASGPAASGTLTAKASIDGRWPNLRSEGELHASALRFDSVAVRQAEAHWRLGSATDAPVEATLTLDGVSVSGRVVERVRAQASGTARAHRLLLDIASDALPPQWLDAVAAPNPSGVGGVTVKAMPGPSAAPAGAQGAADIGRSALTLRAEGGLVDVGNDRSGGWSGTVQELIAQSTASPSRTWLHAQGVRGSVLWAGGPMRASVEPGMAEALGATVRWSRIAWQAGDARTAARLDAQGVVEPVLIAPLLRTLQPDFGWAGDLRVGAHVNVRSAPSVLVDVVVERASGDLSVTDEFGTQALGFSDLRFGIAAKDGVWNFTGALAGSTLGVASAALTARTSSASTWPSADTPVQGVAELRVASLGTWGPWVPAGWRLAGALHANASIAGRFGQPEYVGHVEGTNLGVRNFLQGVNITEGDVAIALQGSTARIERFTAKSGNGSLKLDGSASFDAAPAAQLRLSADRFELLGRRDRRIVASGAASMHLDAQSLGIDGAFKVDEGLIDFTRSDAPSLGDDVEVVRRPTRAASSAAGGSGRAAVAAVPSTAASAPVPALTPAPTSRKVALDLRVDLGEKLRIRGRGLDAGLRGELRLTSPGGRLAANGTVRAVDGTYQAYGQKLGIDRGVITFVGPIENPRLDIEATRPNLDVRVGVVVVGSALDPRVRLFSEPDMSDIDKLSWLVLGRASEGVGSNDIALLQSAALALLSGEGPGVTDRLIQAVGLDSFGVRQQSVGDVKETIVTLGKQISKRWYVGYERGLNATTGSWQLIYRLAQRVTIRAQAGGDNSVDLIWTLRWK
ncbi:MAG: translocation/assembly module TamB domain-containing protein, partial [Pseudomonadota bacterium]|nr:translocation/assembly module TamB domain-containing protein [Pseudomonadota bacterium]